MWSMRAALCEALIEDEADELHRLLELDRDDIDLREDFICQDVLASREEMATVLLIEIIIIIMLAYLYCAAYTRMTMNESLPPCE